MSTMEAIRGQAGCIIYGVIGLTQWWAVSDLLEYKLDWPELACAIVAVFISYIPLIGSIIGVWGALAVWHWPIWGALLLYFWWFPVLMILGILARRN